jgi:hypothetical protein
MTYAMLQDCRIQGAGGVGARPPQLTLTQTGGRLCSPHYYVPPRGFLNLPTALSAAGVQNGNWSNSISPGQLNMSK